MTPRARVATSVAAVLLLTLAPMTPVLADDAPPPVPVETQTPDAATPTPDPSPSETPGPSLGKPPDVDHTTAPAIAAGTVSIDHSTTPFQAITSGFSGATTFTYRWYRGNSATTATTSATAGSASPAYTPVVGDKFLRVAVTASADGQTSVTTYSEAKNYSVVPAGGAVIFPFPPKVGQPIHLEWQEFTTFSAAGDPAGEPNLPTSAGYQWLRNGVAIPGATSATYTPIASDFHKTVSARFTATVPGAAPTVLTSAGAYIYGEQFTNLGISLTGPVAKVLSVGVDYTDPTPGSGVPTKTYQWYRDGAAISGATHSTYTLSKADAHTITGVKVTISKPLYESVPQTANGTFTLEANGPVTIGPETNAKVGEELEATLPLYHVNSGVSPELSYQWLRDGAAIPNETAIHHVITTADRGHRLSIRVTAYLPTKAHPDYLPLVLTSAQTQKIGDSTFSGIGNPLLISSSGTPATLAVASIGLTPIGTSTYQWYRNGAPIAGATHQSYTLTSADRGTVTYVRVTTTKSGYTPVVKTSIQQDFTLQQNTSPYIIPDSSLYRVGLGLSVVLPTYTQPGGGSASTTKAYQWYRNGVAISGATSAGYAMQASDVGKKITVRVTASASGYNSVAGVSAPTPAVQLGMIQQAGGMAVPEIQPGTSAGQLKAVMPAGEILTAGVTYTYQWLRNLTTISGATKSTFTLASTDGNKPISVRVYVHKAGYTTASTVSVADTYGLTSAGVFYSCAMQVGNACQVLGAEWENSHAMSVTPAVTKYQWYRGSTAIVGATSATYIFQVGDYTKADFKVRLSVSGPGIVPATAYSPVLHGPVGLGSNSNPGTATFTENTATNTLTAFLQSGSLQPASPAPVLSYQWYRADSSAAGAGILIPGATKSTYKLNNNADYAKWLFVKITVKRANFAVGSTNYPLTSARKSFTAYPSGSPAIVGTPTVGIPHSAPPVPYVDGGGTVVTTTPVREFQWYRATNPMGDQVPIPGATKSTYTPTAADVGKYLQVGIGARYPGYLTPAGIVAFSSNPVQLGTMTGSFVKPSVSYTASTRTFKASIVAGTITSPSGVTYHYQWTRDGSLISGATASTYKRAPTEFGIYRCQVTVTKAGYHDKVLPISDGFGIL